MWYVLKAIILLVRSTNPKLSSELKSTSWSTNLRFTSAFAPIPFPPLILIVGFSIIGMLKTFEDDLVNYFPKIDYIFTLLDEQLIYLSESTKNIIVIISDLINSY